MTLTEVAVSKVSKEAEKIETRRQAMETKGADRITALCEKTAQSIEKIRQETSEKVDTLTSDIKNSDYFTYLQNNNPDAIPESLRQ